MHLTYKGIHLDDAVQICYYPHFHHNQSVTVNAEIVSFSINGESVSYACSCDHQEWITLSLGSDHEVTMTLEKEMTEGSRVQQIRRAVAVCTCCLLLPRSPYSTWRSPLSSFPRAVLPTTLFTTPSRSIPHHSPFLSSLVTLPSSIPLD